MVYVGLRQSLNGGASSTVLQVHIDVPLCKRRTPNSILKDKQSGALSLSNLGKIKASTCNSSPRRISDLYSLFLRRNSGFSKSFPSPGSRAGSINHAACFWEMLRFPPATVKARYHQSPASPAACATGCCIRRDRLRKGSPLLTFALKSGLIPARRLSTVSPRIGHPFKSKAENGGHCTFKVLHIFCCVQTPRSSHKVRNSRPFLRWTVEGLLETGGGGGSGLSRPPPCWARSASHRKISVGRNSQLTDQGAQQQAKTRLPLCLKTDS